MEIKKVSVPEIRNMEGGNSASSQNDSISAQLFKKALKAFDPSDVISQASFAENLKNSAAISAQSLKFSNHAVERMQARGVAFSQDELGRIQDAVDRAASKGSKDSLILTDKAALIVSVKNNTVITVMDKSALKENLFTNIDSTIVM
jgi:flagellar operon protein